MDTISLCPAERREMPALHLSSLLAAAETIINTPEMSEAPLPPIFVHMYCGAPQVRLGDLLRCWLSPEESPWRFTNEQGHVCYCVFRLFGLGGCYKSMAYDSVTGKEVKAPYTDSSFSTWDALKKHCRKPVCTTPLSLEQVIARLVPQPRLIVHVPHASDKLLKHCGLSIMPAEKERLARRSAALYTDEMVPPDSLAVIAPLSRIVVDTALEADAPEAVPTRAYDGSIIRHNPAELRRRRLLNVYHRPLWEDMKRYVRESLAIHGTARMLSLQAYPSSAAQGDVCIGCDAAHCPAALVQAVEDCAKRHGLSTAFRTPQDGEARICSPQLISLSLSLKPGSYMNERTLQPHSGMETVRRFVFETAELLVSHGCNS